MYNIEQIVEIIRPIAKEYNLKCVWLFGSYAKNKQTNDSDIDILIRTEDVAHGFKLVELKFALEEALKKTVDIATTGSLENSLLEGEDLEEILIYKAE